MKYRKYLSRIKTAAIVTGFIVVMGGLQSCSTFKNRELATFGGEVEQDPKKEDRRYNGFEPKERPNDLGWLGEVEDGLNKMGTGDSHRALASDGAKEVLWNEAGWQFGFVKAMSQFFMNVNGISVPLKKTFNAEGEYYAFVGGEKPEYPSTFSVSKSQGRSVASGNVCQAQLSYWSENAKAYVTDGSQMDEKKCESLLAKMKEFLALI